VTREVQHPFRGLAIWPDQRTAIPLVLLSNRHRRRQGIFQSPNWPTAVSNGRQSPSPGSRATVVGPSQRTRGCRWSREGVGPDSRWQVEVWSEGYWPPEANHKCPVDLDRCPTETAAIWGRAPIQKHREESCLLVTP